MGWEKWNDESPLEFAALIEAIRSSDAGLLLFGEVGRVFIVDENKQVQELPPSASTGEADESFTAEAT